MARDPAGGVLSAGRAPRGPSPSFRRVGDWGCGGATTGAGAATDSSGVKRSEAGPGSEVGPGSGAGRDQAEGVLSAGRAARSPSPTFRSSGDWDCGGATTGAGAATDSSGVKGGEAGPGSGEGAGRDQAEGVLIAGWAARGPSPSFRRVGDWGCGDTTAGAGAAADSSGWGGSITGGSGAGTATLAWSGTAVVGVGRSTGGGAGSGRDRSGSANSSVLTPSTITSPSACAGARPPRARRSIPPCAARGDGGLLGPFPIRFTAGQMDQATGGIPPGRFPTDVPEVLQVA